MRILWLTLALALYLPAADPDWNVANRELLKHFTALVQLDTTNPPGNETRAVDYIGNVLKAAGIESVTRGADPARLNLIARLKGSGAKRPLLLMGHTDTVTIDPKKWKFGPFSAHREGGFLYGRGTSDDKDSVATYLTLMVLLKRLNIPLERDVIFLAGAAEEAGADQWGVGWLVENHFDEIDAEFCIAEGGGFRRQGGKLIVNMVGTAEKIPRGATLIARGPAGHGSRPTPDNAVLALTEAVAKLGRWRPPMMLNDTTRAYFERMAAISPPDQAERFNSVVHPERAAAVQEYFQRNDPMHYAMLTTTITPTILKAGYQLNVIPSEAEATLDIRALPGEDMDKFYAEMAKVVNNPSVEIVPRARALRPATAAGRIDTDLFRAIEKVQASLFPGVRAIPTMGTGATDNSWLRARGIQCYGLGPAIDSEDGALGFGAHSDQERLSEQALYDFLRFSWHVVREITSKVN